MAYDFCKFKNGENGSHAELFFYGDIVSDSWSAWSREDQYPMNVSELLKEIGGNNIDIHINSGGGDVFAGVAICNMLRSCSGRKTVYVDGLAASIASVIAMAGDEIIIPSNAFMMIHKAWTVAMGNADDMRSLADTLDKLDSGIVATYMQKAADGVTEDKISELMASETWLTGSDAAEIFSNVKVAPEISAAASCNSKYMDTYNVPKGYNNILTPKKPTAAQVPAELKKYAAYSDAARHGFGIG